MLKFLNISQMQRMQDALSEIKCEKGKTIIAQGEPGKDFYIIMEGEAAVTVKDGAEVRKVRARTVLVAPPPLAPLSAMRNRLFR